MGYYTISKRRNGKRVGDKIVYRWRFYVRTMLTFPEMETLGWQVGDRVDCDWDTLEIHKLDNRTGNQIFLSNGGVRITFTSKFPSAFHNEEQDLFHCFRTNLINGVILPGEKFLEQSVSSKRSRVSKKMSSGQQVRPCSKTVREGLEMREVRRKGSPHVRTFKNHRDFQKLSEKDNDHGRQS